MTYTDVWVGELTEKGDPLDWGGEWGVGNTPKQRVTPLFPPAARGIYEPFGTVRTRVEDGTYPGKQIDWGAWGAIVTKQEISAFIDELYGPDPAYCGLEHLCEQLAELRTAIRALADERRYVLIAEEF